MEDQTAEINELFAAPNTKLENDVLGELKSTLRIHSLSPQEMFFKWEAYSLKMGSDTQMNYKTAREFKKDLQDALERESRGKAHMQSANKRSTTGTPRNANTGDVFGVYVNVPQSLEMAY
jgi:DNA polymerase alpha subunit B